MVGDADNCMPAVMISIDFEMRWGVHDIYGLDFDGYRGNLEACRPAVQATLAMLSRRNLRATWASVGALALNNWQEYFDWAPPAPAYLDPSLAVRRQYADMDPEGRLHFAPDLISQIVNTAGQDLGSHSFSHLYFREPGVTAADFLADMSAVERLWKARLQTTPVSFVFPRNQSAFLGLLGKTSIAIWRGPESKWFYDRSTKQDNTVLPRVLRLTEAFNPWVKRPSRPEAGMVRASLFVRFAAPETLWRLQLKRIRNELSGLGRQEVLHLWWHPHNLGPVLNRGLRRLEQVLDLAANACAGGRVSSKNMRDLVPGTKMRQD